MTAARPMSLGWATRMEEAGRCYTKLSKQRGFGVLSLALFA